MASYYVTQSGAGTGTGLSLGNAKSVANYNAAQTFSGATPAGGDTIFFSGTITTTITVQSSGTAAGNRLTLDFSGAVLTNATTNINLSGRDNLNLTGGGSFTNGTWNSVGSSIGVNGSLGIYFGGSGVCDSVTISGFEHTGSTSDVFAFIDGHNCTNLIIEGNYIDNGTSLFWTDKTTSSTVTIRYNYFRTSFDTTNQDDIVTAGDLLGMTIIGNKFIQRAPGNASGPSNHNDIIQCYKGGGAGTGFPGGWVIAFNWLELDVTGGSGDNSWLMLENMDNNGGTPACVIYGNIFNAVAGTAGNNGMAPNSNEATADFYFYNNTMIARAGQPGNTSRFLTPGTLYSRNNIGYDPTGGGGTYVSWTMGEGGGATGWNYNFFYQWGTQTNPAGAQGSSIINPNFTAQASYDYSLSVSSALRNAGDSGIGAPYNQGIAFGATWPNPTLANRTATWDPGAYQYVAPAAPTSAMSGVAKLIGGAKIA